jgi:hypothetical protein
MYACIPEIGRGFFEVVCAPSAAPDKWVVDGYPAHYETTYLVSGAK